jgi:glycosyltransferase involved in cell wall biosynthesis
MKIALIGTRGVPAKYGGFETAAEEIGTRLAARGHQVIVYCRNPGQRLRSYRGMALVNLPALRLKQIETLSHTALSIGHAVVRSRPDVAVVFNCANSPLLPLTRLAGIPVAVHVDGLEWRRAKWGRAGKAYYRRAESLATRLANALIADSHGIAAYLADTYGVDSTYAAYGADLVEREPNAIENLGLKSLAYHLVVARFEPENHVDLILRGYARARCRLPLVVVGDAPYSSDHKNEITRLAEHDQRVRLLGSVYDRGTLDQLYANARTYIHGHSVGGTNPSLLRAMGAGTAVVAFDVPFNREVAEGDAAYFTSDDDLGALLETYESDVGLATSAGRRLQEAVVARYRWDDVAVRYESLLLSLQSGQAKRA